MDNELVDVSKDAAAAGALRTPNLVMQQREKQGQGQMSENQAFAGSGTGSGSGPRTGGSTRSRTFGRIMTAEEINLMSQDNDEDDEYGNTSDPTIPQVEPPWEIYVSETATIYENDIGLRRGPFGNRNRMGNVASFPKLLGTQQLGITNSLKWSSTTLAIDNQTKAKITSSFVPDSFSFRRIQFGQPHDYNAYCVQYSKTGNFFIGGANDSKIRIYDTSTDDNISKIRSIYVREPELSILDLAISPDETQIAYTCWSDTVYICKVNPDLDPYSGDGLTGHIPLPIHSDRHDLDVFSVKFSQDGTLVLCGGNDACVHGFDRAINRQVLKITGHEDDVNAVAFVDQSSDIFISGSDDGLVNIWDRRCTAKLVGFFAGHVGGVTSVESSDDGHYVLTNSKDQSMKLWDMRKLSTEEGKINAKNFLGDSTWDYRYNHVPKQLTVSRNPVKGDTSIMSYRGHCVMRNLIRSHFSPSYTGQKYIYTGCSYGRVFIYDLLTGEIVKKLKGHGACVRDVSWHPFKPIIVSASFDNSFGVWKWINTAPYELNGPVPVPMEETQQEEAAASGW